MKILFKEREDIPMLIKPKVIVLVVAPLVAVCLMVGWLLLPGGVDPANAALAEYQVEKLTCGSCVQKIQQALAGSAGVGEVEVSLSNGRSRVEFDPSSISSAEIAELITAAGYPANLRTELSADEYASMRNERTRLGAKYVARVGTRLLSREDFDHSLKLRLGDQEMTPDLLQELRRQLWADLMQKELLLNAADLAGVLIQPGEVDQRFAQLEEQHPDLNKLISQRYGTLESFKDQLRNDMTIQRLFEDQVLVGVEDPTEKNAYLQQWYGELQKNTDVVVFDPQLKRDAASGGGCGGGCCG